MEKIFHAARSQEQFLENFSKLGKKLTPEPGMPQEEDIKYSYIYKKIFYG